jgi:hypothetical protein
MIEDRRSRHRRPVWARRGDEKARRSIFAVVRSTTAVRRGISARVVAISAAFTATVAVDRSANEGCSNKTRGHRNEKPGARCRQIVAVIKTEGDRC